MMIFHGFFVVWVDFLFYTKLYFIIETTDNSKKIKSHLKSAVKYGKLLVAKLNSDIEHANLDPNNRKWIIDKTKMNKQLEKVIENLIRRSKND